MVESILSIIGVGLTILLYYLKNRQANIPKEEDTKIDDAFTGKDSNSKLSDINHDLNDRMRRQDPNSQ